MVASGTMICVSSRRTYNGGIRNTPRRAAAMKGKLNLVKGGIKKLTVYKKWVNSLQNIKQL